MCSPNQGVAIRRGTRFYTDFMLRDKNLIPLSHQHQHALALCVRIERASPIAETDLSAWQAEIHQLFQTEIQIHFAAEERVLFPAALAFQELNPLTRELLAEHTTLREGFAGVQELSAADISSVAKRLATHIRKEERLLFERIQQLLNEEELNTLGKHLEEALKDAAKTCAVPNPATRLRAAK
jgi:hemerythrin-like domain-containing protein